MRRLTLTSAVTLLAILLLVPPAWAEWVWPLRGEVITPYRNGDDPYASGQHRGIDIAGDVGAPVVAAAGGEVRFAGSAGSSGVTVSIRTADGRYDTSYLHLSSAALREGDRIGAGERVGSVGTTGIRSAATPHLHFGVRDAGSRHAYHDPLGFLPPAPTAPQAPRETPAPQPAPVPVGPAPAPVQAPAGHRVPVGAPAPRRVPVRAPADRRVPVHAPADRRVPVRAPADRRVPVRAPADRRVPVRAPADRRVPVHSPADRRVPAGAPSPSGVPVHAPSERPAGAHTTAGRPSPAPSPSAAAEPTGLSRTSEPARGPAAGSAAPASEVPGRPPGRLAAAAPAPDKGAGAGRDLGLMLACLGLVAAAFLLGLTDDGRKATRRTRHRLVRLLQPMLGRR